MTDVLQEEEKKTAETEVGRLQFQFLNTGLHAGTYAEEDG